MYDATVRWLVFACGLLASARLASAQPAPAPTPIPEPTPADPTAPPLPTPTPAPLSEPTPTVPAPVPPRPKATAKIDRAIAEQVCAAQDPSCDWMATLGSLERASMVRALVARGYELESSPWGKVIGEVHGQRLRR